MREKSVIEKTYKECLTLWHGVVEKFRSNELVIKLYCEDNVVGIPVAMLDVNIHEFYCFDIDVSAVIKSYEVTHWLIDNPEIDFIDGMDIFTVGGELLATVRGKNKRKLFVGMNDFVIGYKLNFPIYTADDLVQ